LDVRAASLNRLASPQQRAIFSWRTTATPSAAMSGKGSAEFQGIPVGRIYIPICGVTHVQQL